jgi:hypothetical protein
MAPAAWVRANLNITEYLWTYGFLVFTRNRAAHCPRLYVDMLFTVVLQRSGRA